MIHRIAARMLFNPNPGQLSFQTGRLLSIDSKSRLISFHYLFQHMRFFTSKYPFFRFSVCSGLSAMSPFQRLPLFSTTYFRFFRRIQSSAFQKNSMPRRKMSIFTWIHCMLMRSKYSGNFFSKSSTICDVITHVSALKVS